MKTRKMKYGLKRKNDSEEITLKFLQILNIVKLFHWKTTNYATHKATDDLYSKLNDNIDKYVEVMLGGQIGTRLNFSSLKCIPVSEITTNSQIKKLVDNMKVYLEKMVTRPDLLNIRDDIINDMNQFLYLLTFKN
jgi:hypothetical protein